MSKFGRHKLDLKNSEKFKKIGNLKNSLKQIKKNREKSMIFETLLHISTLFLKSVEDAWLTTLVFHFLLSTDC